jgi:5,10-methylenetetrahydromethanopterin reductase
MDCDIFLAPAADSWKVVKRAEELGFRRAWFYDTQLLNAEVFVSMAAAAMQTSTIRLGTGVLIPSNRIAPVAASGLASLNALAPGRIDFGISTGFTARRTMGLRPVKLGDMEEYVRVVCGLLAGETLEWTFEDPFTGPKAELREQLRELARAGFDHVGLTVRYGYPEMLEEWADVFEGV